MRFVNTVILCSSLCMVIACNKQKQPEVDGIPPAAAPKEVTDFFNTYLPESSGSLSECQFNFVDEECCYLINDIEELEAIAPPSAELPSVDFDKFSLIIGYHCFGYPRFVLENQAIEDTGNEIKLNLVFRDLGGASPTAVTFFYFWGLYDKIQDKPLNPYVKII